jgi:hypothetical protein
MIPLSEIKEKISKEECLKKYQQEVARLAKEYRYNFALSGKEEYAGIPGSPIMKRAVLVAGVDLVNRKTGESVPFKVGEVKYNSLVYLGDEPYCSIDIATPPVTQE